MDRCAARGCRAAVKRGDIYMVSLDPSQGREQQGHRPVLIVSATEFNAVTKRPVVLPITSGGAVVRRIGFAVEIVGIKTIGVVRCDQPRLLDLIERHGRKLDELPPEILDEVLGKLLTLFA